MEMETIKREIISELYGLEKKAEHSNISIADIKDIRDFVKTLYYLEKVENIIDKYWAEVEADHIDNPQHYNKQVY